MQQDISIEKQALRCSDFIETLFINKCYIMIHQVFRLCRSITRLTDKWKSKSSFIAPCFYHTTELGVTWFDHFWFAQVYLTAMSCRKCMGNFTLVLIYDHIFQSLFCLLDLLMCFFSPSQEKKEEVIDPEIEELKVKYFIQYLIANQMRTK